MYVNVVTSTHIPITEKPNTLINDYEENKSYRLPNNSYPTTYNIEITWIDEENFTFDGKVLIENVMRFDTNTIVLHKLQTDIKTVTLKKLPDGQTINAHYDYSNITDFLTITNNVIMEKDSVYVVEITYRGVLRSGNRGFFRQSYLMPNGEKRQEKF